MKYVHQLDSSDCGAACLAMISSHYGSIHSVTQIREAAGTDRLGTNLQGMIQAAQTLKFDAKAVKGTYQTLSPELPVPFISHWINLDGNHHFIVVRKIDSKRVHVLDPGDKERRHYTIDQFMKQWTGYALFVNPTPDFKLNQEKKGTLRKFLPLLLPHHRTILLLLLASFFLTIIGIVSSLYFQFLIDEVLGAKAEVTLHVLSLGLVLLTLFKVLLTSVRSQFLQHFSLKTSLALSLSYVKHVLTLPMRFFDSRKVGEILSRFEDGEKIRSILSTAAISMLLDLGMMIFAGFYLFFQSTVLFFITIITVPLSALTVYAFAKFFGENYRSQMAQNADNQSFLVETLNGIATVKGLNAEQFSFHEFEKRLVMYQKLGKKAWDLGNIKETITGLIDGWGANLIFWIGAFLILKDQLSLGQLITFNALSTYLTGPLKRFIDLQPALQEAMVAADRMGEVMQLPPERDPGKTLLSPGLFHGCFEVKDITFRYGTKRPVLMNLNFTIDPGSKVAFVGPSGCGKSTLIKLFLKFYNPEMGNILLDGHSLLDLDISYLRSRIGYVPQDVFLFSGSVRENLCLHQQDATFEEIVNSAKRAQAHEFISELPERYDTVLAERGSSLSGGELQRLALARALLGKPDILIFDEATSALDVITEKAVHETIWNLSNEGLTTILVAHRLATVVDCDKIFVMEKGRIIEAGTHDELVKMGGSYTKLWEYQKL